jgi:hypothetical protein
METEQPEPTWEALSAEILSSMRKWFIGSSLVVNTGRILRQP